MKHDRQDSGSVPRCSAVDDIGLMVVVAQATAATLAAVFRQHRLDITWIDFRLPDDSGTEAARDDEVRNEAHFSVLPSSRGR